MADAPMRDSGDPNAHAEPPDVFMHGGAGPATPWEMPPEFAQRLREWHERTMTLVNQFAQQARGNNGGNEDQMDVDGSANEERPRVGVTILQSFLHLDRIIKEDVMPRLHEYINNLDVPENHLDTEYDIGETSSEDGEEIRGGVRLPHVQARESQAPQELAEGDEANAVEDLALRARRIRLNAAGGAPEDDGANYGRRIPPGAWVIKCDDNCAVPLQPEFLAHARENPRGLSACFLYKAQVKLLQLVNDGGYILRGSSDNRDPIPIAEAVYMFCVQLSYKPGQRWTEAKIDKVIDIAITCNTSQCLVNAKNFFNIHGNRRNHSELMRGARTTAQIQALQCPPDFIELVLSFRKGLEKDNASHYHRVKQVASGLEAHRKWLHALNLVLDPHPKPQGDPDRPYQDYLLREVAALQLPAQVSTEGLDRLERNAFRLNWLICKSFNAEFTIRSSIRNSMAKITSEWGDYAALCAGVGPGAYVLLHEFMDKKTMGLIGMKTLYYIGCQLPSFTEFYRATPIVEEKLWNPAILDCPFPSMPNFESTINFIKFRRQMPGTSLIEAFMNIETDDIDSAHMFGILHGPRYLALKRASRMNLDRFPTLSEPDPTVPPLSEGVDEDILNREIINLDLNDTYFNVQDKVIRRLNEEVFSTIAFETQRVYFDEGDDGDAVSAVEAPIRAAEDETSGHDEDDEEAEDEEDDEEAEDDEEREGE